MRSHHSRDAATRRSATVLALFAITACAPDSSVAPRVESDVTATLSRQTTTKGRILFHVESDFVTRLYSMNDDGTNILAISDGVAEVSGASWAPDGKRIIVSATVDAAVVQFAVHSMNQDGSKITTLTTPPVGCNDLFPVSIAKQIAFVRQCGADMILVIMNADGTGLSALATGLDRPLIGASTKANQVAYSKGGDIWVVSVGTGMHTNLSNTPTLSEFQPVFSPSGKRIAFVRDDATGARRIFTMDADGAMLTLIATDAVSPVWSPDGKRLAYSDRSDGVADIVVTNADGTVVTNVTGTSIIAESPVAWAP
ncbi:MAG TPA: hypothetical protein VFZ21_15560 [Gemmatimonadaceae bacterium]|nr:hypothetical protein [Gemmatimonadaceae bacterium]